MSVKRYNPWLSTEAPFIGMPCLVEIEGGIAVYAADYDALAAELAALYTTYEHDKQARQMAEARIAEVEAELAETQRQLKLIAPIGRYNGRTIEEWSKYGASLEAALRKYGRHLGDGTMGGMCEAAYDALALGPCTCGLDAALGNSDEQ